MFLSWRFQRLILCNFKFNMNSDPLGNLSDQSQTRTLFLTDIDISLLISLLMGTHGQGEYICIVLHLPFKAFKY